jgi:uncharacterized metal-binding protein YceD (DUF177 family)
MSGILDWSLKVDDIGPNGYHGSRFAGPEERARLAGELDIVAVDRLEARVEVRMVGTGRYRLTGRVTGGVTQTCVVTLEPVQSPLDEELAVEFWPVEDIGPLAEGEHSVLEAEVPEPIEHGRIEIGRIVFEHVAAGLDPYPRKPEAAFDAEALGVGEQSSKPESPFAVLARLKSKPESNP